MQTHLLSDLAQDNSDSLLQMYKNRLSVQFAINAQE